MGAVFAGRYELVDPLGEGGGGVVWRVWDHRDRRYLAAKVLRDVDATSLLRFMREQSFRIEHPHVITPLGWAGEDDRVLLTMPLVRGGSVASLIGDYGALPAPLAGVLASQLFGALDAIHRLGLVHRDVKPANLLLDATGIEAPHVWLADFGLATGIHDPRLTHTASVVGTAGYVAPETEAGADPHPAADMFAAGMSIAEMLSGVRPERGADAATLLADTSAPAPLAELVADLTCADPAERPDAAAARQRLDATTVSVARPPVTTSDDPVEIFDHVPKLPDGWTDDGPEQHDPHAAAPDHPAPVRPSSRVVGPAVQIGVGTLLAVLAMVLALR